MERGDVVPAAVVAAARSGSLAAEVVSGALGQQGPLRNHSAAPHTLQLCCQDAMALGAQARLAAVLSTTHDPSDKCPFCSSQLELRLTYAGFIF